MASLHRSNPTESRLGSALTISVILHVVVAAFFAWPSSDIGIPGQLRATLVLGNQRGADLGQDQTAAHAPDQQTSGQSGNVSPAKGVSGSRSSTGAGNAKANSPQGSSGGGSRTGFYARATVLLESPIPDDLQDGIFGDRSYLPGSQVVPQPQITDGLKLTYPESAYGSPRRATVNVAVFLDETGKVVDAVPLNENSQDKEFVDTALLALRNARYLPGQRDGRPARSKFLVTVRFGYE